MKIMKKKILIVATSSIMLLIILQVPSFGRYYENIKKIKAAGSIAEPIIKVEQLQDKIIAEANRESDFQEYYFIVRNYEKENEVKRINEVDFLCDIEIKNSNSNFPVKYKLYDCETNLELLNDSSEVKRN